MPSILGNLSGWLIFELQIVAVAKIRGITPAGLAAGAMWVTSESTMAALQCGWIQATQMRIVNLLGKQDPGAPKSLAILVGLSSLMVAIFNIPLLLFPGAVAEVVSNDPQVRAAFKSLVWVLVVHSQTRILSILSYSILIPVGKGALGVLICFICFYAVATPVAGVVALTDLVTKSVHWKMVACIGATPLAQGLLAIFGFAYIAKLDWRRAATMVQERANTDLHDPGEKSALDAENLPVMAADAAPVQVDRGARYSPVSSPSV